MINAADLDGEFDAIEAAFNASTGHTHDGTSAEGAPIVVIGPAQEWVVDGSALKPKLDNTYDIGTSTAEVRDLWVDGTANIDALVADTADINSGTVDGAVIGGTTPAAITGTTITATTGFVGPLTGSVTGNVTGNADTATLATQATALSTNRTFSITGDVTASAVNFNGTGNVVLTATIDPDLAGIAALSWGNNEAPFYNAGAWQKYTVSGYSRSLLVATDSASARTTLGATTTGNSLFTAADAAAGRTALGLGTMATQAATAVNITGGAFNGTVGAATPASGTFTSLIATSLARIVASVPVFELSETGTGTTTHNRTRIFRSGNFFGNATVDNNGTSIANNYLSEVSPFGAIYHEFFVGQFSRLKVEASRTDVNVGNTNGSQGFFINGGTYLGTPVGWSFTAESSFGPPVLLPATDATHQIGTGGRRISNIYLLNAPIVSSDARLKENIADLTDKERRAAAKIKTRTYTLKATGQKKVGYIAQEVIEAMASEGLDAFEYGLVSDGETYGVDYDAINAFRLG